MQNDAACSATVIQLDSRFATVTRLILTMVCRFYFFCSGNSCWNYDKKLVKFVEGNSLARTHAMAKGHPFGRLLMILSVVFSLSVFDPSFDSQRPGRSSFVQAAGVD